jgi:hypothetical protein
MRGPAGSRVPLRIEEKWTPPLRATRCIPCLSSHLTPSARRGGAPARVVPSERGIIDIRGGFIARAFVEPPFTTW